METIKVIVNGGAGKMGREVVRAITKTTDIKLVAVTDLIHTGEDAGMLAGIEPLGLSVTNNLERTLAGSGAAVMIDFTSPLTVLENIGAALRHRVSPVVGTTGIDTEALADIESWVEKYDTGAIIAPNFALGAILMTKAAQLCARYMENVEIIEMHHDEKLDAPSGTAINTASLLNRASGKTRSQTEILEKTPGVRGGRINGIPIHSIRLPGLVAHQEILFGSEGQLLSLRHDALNRSCFIPGLLMAVRRAPANKQLIYGMENLLD